MDLKVPKKTFLGSLLKLIYMQRATRNWPESHTCFSGWGRFGGQDRRKGATPDPVETLTLDSTGSPKQQSNAFRAIPLMSGRANSCLESGPKWQNGVPSVSPQHKHAPNVIGSLEISGGTRAWTADTVGRVALGFFEGLSRNRS